MKTIFNVKNYLTKHSQLAEKLDTQAFQKGIEIVKESFKNNNKIITCGNGGSASTASHYITDWNKMVNLATGKKFRGISLCDNVGLITAFANDISYEDVFSGQLDALIDKGDLLVAISGSGNSPNILKGIIKARSLGANILGIVGYDGGKMLNLCDHIVLVPSFDMQLCEDVHLMFGHMVMKSLCNLDIS